MNQKQVIGILAPVDAGKTTLSEGLLYLSGKIRKLGRVDNKDAYLDTDALEKERGITIFSKQAVFTHKETTVMLMDTPGHVDFSAEMERTLQILDYAILVVSGADGVQGHTKTLWKLLDVYDIPVFIFVNKMDQSGTEKVQILEQLKRQLSEQIVSFDQSKDRLFDDIAMCHEHYMEQFLDTGVIEDDDIKRGIVARKIYPCYWGSALKLQGVDVFLDAIDTWTLPVNYVDSFGAKVFKISRDDQGNRLTHMKITGGSLKVKDLIQGPNWEEKVNQIRLYSGTKFDVLSEATSGMICAVTGLSQTVVGDNLGNESREYDPLLEPVLAYRVILPDDVDPRVILPKLKQLEEEEPELKFTWVEEHSEIHVKLMGEVQTEILYELILSRFNVQVQFGMGQIVYKETVIEPVVGIGHFEPLRHYAEVQVLIEPASGLQFDNQCSEDLLAKNWQNLVMTHLQERSHVGVLTGSLLTDIKITLISGKAHPKHTSGGDFREATYRAVRQGLKEAKSALLEPYYHFQLEIPDRFVGRAMTDVERMFGECQLEYADGEMAYITGKAPVSTMVHYQMEVSAYSRGEGKLFMRFGGYGICHNAEEVIASYQYDSESDIQNPTGSVFCRQGAGIYVPWYDVKSQAHTDRVKDLFKSQERTDRGYDVSSRAHHSHHSQELSLEEINQILESTYSANKGKKDNWKKQRKTFFESSSRDISASSYLNFNLESYLLVDGYNIIFSWPELNTLAEDNMDGARSKLIDMLSNYQAVKKNKIILVFDAYRVEGRREEMFQMHNIFVVYTGEAQTADQYIEKFSHQNQKKYQITVATSDGLQQMIIRGAGSRLLSARELKEDIEQTNQHVRDLSQSLSIRHSKVLEDVLSDDVKEVFESIRINLKNERH